MATKVTFVSKTQHYLKVKKPQLERERRARINKCLDAIKTLVADIQNDDAILRMDKAEMLEATIVFMREESKKSLNRKIQSNQTPQPALDGFRNGYMNAVNEVSRVMAGMPGMSVEIGKSVMTHLGFEFNRMLKKDTTPLRVQTGEMAKTSKAPLSPASSGYHSDDCDDCSMMTSPAETKQNQQNIWRPW